MVNRNSIIAVVGLFPFIASGCNSTDKTSGVTKETTGQVVEVIETSSNLTEEERLARLARNYIAANHADWVEETKRRHLIVDKGNHWEVTFALPPDTLGGSPAVRIDKESGRVTEAFHYQ